MEKNQLSEMMEATMSRIREMVDVNTIIGTPIKTDEGVMLIPVSRVSFGFTAGGSEFASKNRREHDKMPFGGASGAGVAINPVAFLVVKPDGEARILSVTEKSSPIEAVIDGLPSVVAAIKKFIGNKKDETVDSEQETVDSGQSTVDS